MTEMPWNNIITGIVTFVAGGGGVFILNLLKTKKEQLRADKKQDSELRLSEVEQAFTIYKEVAGSLRHDIEQITKGAQEAEKHYMEAKEQAARAETENKFLKQQLAEIQKKA